MQRVNYARLTSNEFTSSIGFGLLATVGVSKNDTIEDIRYLAKKIVNMRQFKDDENKCNKSLLDIQGEMMIVSNFTLQATIKSGTRPDFSHAGDNDFAYSMYQNFISEIESFGIKVATGNFGNHMHIDTELDGPFTIIIESEGRE